MTTRKIIAIFVLFTLFSQGNGQTCPVDIPDNEKIDCWPWPTHVDEATCNARGCAWCPKDGVPYCYGDPLQNYCPSSIPEANRVDCHPEPGASRESCNQRECIWCETQTPGIPFCFRDNSTSQGGENCPAGISEAERVDCLPVHTYPPMPDLKAECLARWCHYCSASGNDVPWCFMPKTTGYKLKGSMETTAKGFTQRIERKKFPTWYSADIEELILEAEFQKNHRLRVKIHDPANARWEVPLNIESPATAAPSPLYTITLSDAPTFHFKVTRKENNEVLFDTSLGGLIYTDQAIHLHAKLPTSKMYGFGEQEQPTFLHDMNRKRWGMWGRDQPVGTQNGYGVHPYFTALDNYDKAFSVLFLNSNAQEVETMPAPGISYRTNGGILDMYFFFGPTPEQVVQQYTEAVGRPLMPPYFVLGFHLSRYGYDTIGNMQAAINRMRQYDIPHDVQHGDIDYFYKQLDFTYDTTRYNGLPEYVRHLKQEGTRFITILDPFIGYNEPGYQTEIRGTQAGAWVTEADGVTPTKASCWPGPSYYADYFKPAAQQWWIDECKLFHETIDFEGLWIDMNEPAAFSQITPCNSNMLNNPIFKPRGVVDTNLYEKSLCLDSRDAGGIQYNTHSLYGWSQAEPSLRAARESAGNKRSYVISRSTFPGAGRYAGHWLGDNHPQWYEMQRSIVGMLHFNQFGLPFIGADICGFMGSTTKDLCHRWMELGAFYTFSRNHNGKGHADQDPGVWPEVAATSRKVLHIRYRLLPYLYTLFHYAHTLGSTVIRPLMHEFVTDRNTHNIDRQFLWGPAFLITPVLDEGQRGPRNEWSTLSAPMNHIPLHIRGGHILPTQQPANCTMTSRTLPMGLIAALDDARTATGSLFWDDADVIGTYVASVFHIPDVTINTFENSQHYLTQFLARRGRLTSTISHNGYQRMAPLYFGEITVLGETESVSQVSVNGMTWSSFTYSNQILNITSLNLPLIAGFTITWS